MNNTSTLCVINTHVEYFFTGHDIRSRDLATHGTAGPQVQGLSASYDKSYARGFSAGSNPEPGNPAEN
jgi:hypothetical protein